MTKQIFHIDTTINYINEAGLLLFDYTNYVRNKGNSPIDFIDSWVKGSADNVEVIRIEDKFQNFPAFIDFQKSIRREAYLILEEFFDRKNQDIFKLSSIYEENDKGYLPFLPGLFQNFDLTNNGKFSYDDFKNIYDLIFFKFIGIDLFAIYEMNVNTYDDMIEQAKKLDLNFYLANANYPDEDLMTLLRSYVDTASLYQRLRPLIENLAEIIKEKTYLIEEIFNETIENIKKDDFKIANDFVIESGLNDFLETSYDNVPINIILLAPTTAMVSFNEFENEKSAMKLGILYDRYDSKDQKNRLSNISSDLKAVADPTRIEILDFLKESDHYAKELSDKLYITPATLSYHMNVLQTAGFVGVYKKGRKYYYYLRKNGFESLIDKLTNFKEDIKENEDGEN